ncbi:MAG TPA: hypothetical protein PLL54_11490, partial [Dermatophilaceae bacterium]|nr:hypothetical protein [Dermatophilaceae bacterium]
MTSPCPFCGTAALTDRVTSLPSAPVGRAPAPRPQSNLPKFVVLGVIGVCVVGALVTFLLGRGGSETQAQSPQPAAPISTPAAPTVAPSTRAASTPTPTPTPTP